MEEKPNALRLADELGAWEFSSTGLCGKSAAELRRLHFKCNAMLKALKAAEPYLRHADVAFNVYVQARAAIAQAED